MGSDKEKQLETKTKESQKRVSTCIACLWSCLVSLSGGFMLAWWTYEYHPKNSQLWMVPFGLILFVTPLLIWFAVFVSGICSFTGEVRPTDGSSVLDPENMISQVVSTSC